MKISKIPKPGTTQTRKAFWDNVHDFVSAQRKLKGRNVRISEFDGYGTIIDLFYGGSGSGSGAGGACCRFDGGCDDVESFMCNAPDVFHAGESCASFRCEGPCAVCTPCEGCECFDNKTYDECQDLFPEGGAVGWLLDGNCITNDCAYFFGTSCDLTGVGACCDEFCNCVDGTTEEECTGLGGTFWCDGGECPTACCFGYPGCC